MSSSSVGVWVALMCSRNGSEVATTPTGLSLLDLRPELLLASIHDNTILLAQRLSSLRGEPDYTRRLPSSLAASNRPTEDAGELGDDLAADSVVAQEVMDKVAAMELKIGHQIKKYLSLAAAEERRAAMPDNDDEEEGQCRQLVGWSVTHRRHHSVRSIKCVRPCRPYSCSGDAAG